MKGKLPGFVLVIGQAVMDWWDTWLDSTLITLIWAVAQITIVLGPPATFGVYYVVNNMFSGENLGVRGMIAGMKMYFGKAWIWGAINLFAILVIYTNVMFYRQWDSPFAPYLLTFISVLAGMWFFSTFYSLPFFMELQKPSVLLAIRNGWLLDSGGSALFARSVCANCRDLGSQPLTDLAVLPGNPDDHSKPGRACRSGSIGKIWDP